MGMKFMTISEIKKFKQKKLIKPFINLNNEIRI